MKKNKLVVVERSVQVTPLAPGRVYLELKWDMPTKIGIAISNLLNEAGAEVKGNK